MVIGVTGGIASGKSTIASFFKQWGAKVIDVDKLGWKILESKQKEVVEEFSKEILSDGKIDRKKLGHLVFECPDKKIKLDALIHPPLIKELKNQVTTYKSRVANLVVDCALIYEWKIGSWFDKIILVTSSYENKVKRLLDSGYSRKEAKNRIQAQLPDEVKKADWVIKNDADLKSLRKTAKEVWNEIIKIG